LLQILGDLPAAIRLGRHRPGPGGRLAAVDRPARRATFAAAPRVLAEHDRRMAP
jgi:hypothetical protein